MNPNLPPIKKGGVMLTKKRINEISETDIVTWVFDGTDKPPKTLMQLLKETAINLYAKLEKAEAELAECQKQRKLAYDGYHSGLKGAKYAD